MKKTIVTEEIDMYLSYLHECGCGEEEGKVKGTNIIYDDDDEMQNECSECIEEDDLLDEDMLEEGPIQSFISRFPKLRGEVSALSRVHPNKNEFEIVDLIKRKYNLFGT